jgi:hypothetical protein
MNIVYSRNSKVAYPRFRPIPTEPICLSGGYVSLQRSEKDARLTIEVKQRIRRQFAPYSSEVSRKGELLLSRKGEPLLSRKGEPLLRRKGELPHRRTTPFRARQIWSGFVKEIMG